MITQINNVIALQFEQHETLALMVGFFLCLIWCKVEGEMRERGSAKEGDRKDEGGACSKY